MKKAKRLLAVLLASLMLFTAAYVPSYATGSWHTAKYTEGQKYYFDYDHGASWLLDQLDNLLAGLGLCLNCNELNDLVGVGINIFTSNILVNLDKFLEGDFDDDPIYCVDESGEGALDLRSVDGLILSLRGLGNCLNNGGLAKLGDALGLFGDLLGGDYGLKFDGLDGAKIRSKVSDTQVLEMLINWLANQKGLLQGLLGGSLNWGSLLSGLIGDLLGDLFDPVTIEWNDNKINGDKLIKDLLYNLLIDSTAAAAPTDGTTIDDWLQKLVDWLVIDGTGETAETGAFSMVGANAEPIMPAIGEISLSMSVYELVNAVINGLFGGTLKDLLVDLLYDLLGVEITAEFPKGNPAVLTDSTYNLIIGIVQGLFEDNGAPKLELTGEATQYPVPQIDALLDWLLVGDPENNVNSALDTFILIDYYGFHIQDNFMSLLNDVARLLINLLPSLGLFADSAHLAYSPDDLIVSWYIDEEFNLVDSNSETKVTQTYVTFETNEVIYPTEYTTDANGTQVPSAYCYLDDKSSVNTTDSSNETTYRNPSLVRPNYVITTNMVFANIIKLALNDFIEGCYFPEWTTDIPSVLAYGMAAMAAPIVPENNYYERLDAYHAVLEGEISPIDNVVTIDGDEVEILYYSINKVITIKDINGNVSGTASVQVPKAAMDILASFGAKRLNGVFHFNTDLDKFTTDTNFERFLAEFIMWAANQYMPAFVGDPSVDSSGKVTFVKTNTASTNDPIFASAMTTLANSIYSNYTKKTVKETVNWDAVYDFIDNSLFKLLPTSWLPQINGSAQFLNQWLFENLINFNLQGILNLFQVNEDPAAELNNSAVKVIINVLDRVLALVFNDNGVMITSGQTEGRQGVVMNNNVTTISSLAGLLDCSSASASLPMLVSNLLTLLNRYKVQLLGTILPLVLGGEYIKPYLNAHGVPDESQYETFFPNGQTDLHPSNMNIQKLEDYMSELFDNRNATVIKTLSNKDNAEAAVIKAGDDKPRIVKNSDGVSSDIMLSTGNVFGTYASRDEANKVLEQLRKGYVEEILVDEATETYQYKIWTSKSYLTSATATPASDAAGDYTKYSDFGFAQLTYRTEASPKVSYDDDYYFFQYEDFGKSGYLYNNRKDSVDSGNEFIDSYNSFATGDLVDAYGEWYMFWVESELKKANLYDENGDGRVLTENKDETETVTNDDGSTSEVTVTYYADGNPGIPNNTMYPYYTTTNAGFTYYEPDVFNKVSYDYAARIRNGFLDPINGKAVTGYSTATFNDSNFEQLAIALEYAADTKNNVVLSDEDAESVIRLWLGTIDFDITKNSDGQFTGSTQWEDLTEAQLETIDQKCTESGFTFTTETAEDGTTVYKLARPAFKYFKDGTTFGVDAVPALPQLSAAVIMQYADKSIAGTQTYAEEVMIAQHKGYYKYIESLYENRIRLLDEYDEISWRSEKAEDGRITKIDTTVLDWLLNLTENDYKDSQTRKRNVIYIQDEYGNNIESKAFTTSSYNAFREAYDYGLAIQDAATDANTLALGVTQAMVTAAYQGILEAWQALVPFTGFADWTQIDAYVAIAEEILNDPYRDDPDFGIKSGLAELEAALKDAYVYTDNGANPDTVYDLYKNSKNSYDSEAQSEIGSASAALSEAINALVYHNIPTIKQDPEKDVSVNIQNVKYESQIQESHIFGLEEGVGFGDGTLDADAVVDMLGLKTTGFTVDGSRWTFNRTNSTHGSGTGAVLEARFQTRFARFKYFAVLYGDVNGDTRIDNTDASAINLYVARNENNAIDMGSAKFEAADVTHDGAVDVEDVQMIINHYSLAGEISQDEHSPVPEATATFIIDGETYKTETFVCGSHVPVPAAPLKADYTFKGWYYLDDETQADKILEESTVMPAHDMTFTAVYEAVTTA